MPGSFQKTNVPIAARISTGTTVQMISRRVEPWICGPSAVRARLPRRYRTTKTTSAALDDHEDDAGEDEDEDVRIRDPVGVGRVGRGRQQATRSARCGRREEERAAGRKNDEKALRRTPSGIV